MRIVTDVRRLRISFQECALASERQRAPHRRLRIRLSSGAPNWRVDCNFLLILSATPDHDADSAIMPPLPPPCRRDQDGGAGAVSTSGQEVCGWDHGHGRRLAKGRKESPAGVAVSAATAVRLEAQPAAATEGQVRRCLTGRWPGALTDRAGATRRTPQAGAKESGGRRSRCPVGSRQLKNRSKEDGWRPAATALSCDRLCSQWWVRDSERTEAQRSAPAEYATALSPAHRAGNR